MKKTNKQEPVPFTGETIVSDKVDGILTEVFKVKIENGIVVDITRLTKAPNVAAASIGAADRWLWESIRTSKNINNLVKEKPSEDL